VGRTNGRGGGMRIKSVESQVVALPYDMGGPHGYFAGRLWDRMEILLVRIETDDGLVGCGEAFGHAAIPTTRTALDTIVAPLVVGRDADDIEALSRSILHSVHLLGRNGPFVYAYSGVEIALWDIRGKRQGKPLHALLGNRHRTELDAYASLLTYGKPDLVAKNTSAARAAGYRSIKLHEVTRENILAGKNAPGVGDTPIMVDVNCLWSVPQAHQMAESLAGDGLMWLEEPTWPPEDCRGLAEIRRHGIPISAGENVAGVFGFQTLIDANAIDIAQPSVTKIGGVGEMLRVYELCGARGVQVTPHSPYFGPGFIASVHIIAALAEKPLVEVLWLDMEANPFDPWVRTHDGRVRVPQGPGLGCDPDPAVLARYRTGEVVITKAEQ
jgi:D-galactarolactone cycloisomerase